MIDRSELGIIGLAAAAIGLVGILIITSPDEVPPTVSVYEDGKELQVATLNNSYLPEGAIIHKDYGKGWKCVQIDSHFLLIREYGTDSFAASVDTCNAEANTIEGAHILMPTITWGPELFDIIGYGD